MTDDLETRAKKLLSGLHEAGGGYDFEISEITDALEAVRAEATLAERERIEGLEATIEDERAAHQDTLRLLAIARAENAQLSAAVRDSQILIRRHSR